MPFVGKAVDGGVFAHGGDGDTIGQSQAAELEGGEEVVDWLGHRGLDVAGSVWSGRFNLGWYFDGFIRNSGGFCGFWVDRSW